VDFLAYISVTINRNPSNTVLKFSCEKRGYPVVKLSVQSYLNKKRVSKKVP